LRSVDVPKGSFYHYFPSKEAFGAELIDSYADYFSRKLDSFFRNEQHPPLEGLRGFTDDATSAMKRFRYARGCLVGNLGQEMSVLPQSFRQQLFDVFIDWQQRTAKCLRAAQATGAISSKIATGLPSSSGSVGRARFFAPNSNAVPNRFIPSRRAFSSSSVNESFFV
jgi:TetR/AcrR family transcriptional regulator, transcriptional repressor for nem operon